MQLTLPASEKKYTLVVKVVDCKSNKPVPNVNVKVFRVEKEAISPLQWTENLRNGTPFKRLMASLETDKSGCAAVVLAEGIYEGRVEAYSLNQVCKLNQDLETLFVQPGKKSWWQ